LELFEGPNEFLPFVPPQIIVASAQIVTPVLRQTFEAVPLFAQMFFVSRREILPALIVAQNIFSVLRTQIAPPSAIVASPTGNGHQQ
jgi:hypothetical protein